MKEISKHILIFFLICVPILTYAQEFSYKEKKGFRSQDSYIFDAQFSPFRNYFAITYGNNTIEVYDRNWRKVFEHQGNTESYSGTISFSPDEEYLAFSRYKSTNDIAILSLSELNFDEKYAFSGLILILI